MEKTTVYDLPLRFFHWLFAILFLIAFGIAKTADDETPLFSFHMLAGLSLLFILLLRVFWGLIGTKYSRFTSFKLKPTELIGYFKNVLLAKTKSYYSHNPASSFAAILMFGLTIGLGITGIRMSWGYESEFLEETHEIMANLFILTVIAHVAGILYHHLSHKDALWSSMIDGKKSTLDNTTGIKSIRAISGVLFLMLSFTWMGYLYSNFDKTTQSLNILGTQLQLGENEQNEYEGTHNWNESRKGREHDNDEDDD